MAKQQLTAIALVAAILIHAEHYDEGDVLIVGKDIALEEAEQLVRLGRAAASDSKRTKRRALEEQKAPQDPPPPPPA